MNDHIVQSYDEQFRSLHSLIARMFGIVQVQLTDSMTALKSNDITLAQKVCDMDKNVDVLEIDAEDLAMNIIALRSPVANDLREVIAALKIAGLVERLGDYSKNIAKRSISITEDGYTDPPIWLTRMQAEAEIMVRNVTDAYVEQDAKKAMDVWTHDQKLDSLHSTTYQNLLKLMADESKHVGALTHYVLIAKNLERIGDHATNIAEIIYYVATGSRLDEKRPKADTTASVM